jgi:dTDP-glucose 4,6-dehydratase/UDP-glucose 4-epimerase
MNILIIGSMGFIGRNLEKYFRETSYTVYGCDVVHIVSQKNFTMLDANASEYAPLFQGNSYDVCINCGGAANVSQSFENTLFDFELNSFNVIRILEAIRRYNPECNFINISSAAVYGNPAVLPISEAADVLPVSPYGYHKLMAEIIMDEYYKLWRIKTCSARIFSAYGNGLKKQLLYDISKKILRDSEVHLFGTGRETRDFIHIDDICHAFDCIIKHDSFKASKINVANGEQISINKIVELFNKEWKHNKKIIFDGIEKHGDPINWAADISVLRSYGYKPEVNISDGIRRYINWIQSEKLE